MVPTEAAGATPARAEGTDVAQLGIICRNSQDSAWYEVSTTQSRSICTAAGSCLQVTFRAHVPIEPDLLGADALPSRLRLQPVPAAACSCLQLQPGTRVLALDVSSLASSRYTDAVVRRRIGRDAACPQGRCQCSFIVQAAPAVEGTRGPAAGSPHPVMHTIYTLCCPGAAATEHPVVQRWAQELQPAPTPPGKASPPAALKPSPPSASSSPTSSSTTATISDPPNPTSPTPWDPPPHRPTYGPPSPSDTLNPSPPERPPTHRSRKRRAGAPAAPSPTPAATPPAPSPPPGVADLPPAPGPPAHERPLMPLPHNLARTPSPRAPAGWVPGLAMQAGELELLARLAQAGTLQLSATTRHSITVAVLSAADGLDPQLTKGQADTIVSRLRIPEPGRPAATPPLAAFPAPGSTPRHPATRPPVYPSILSSLPSHLSERSLAALPSDPPAAAPRHHLDLTVARERSASPHVAPPQQPPMPPAAALQSEPQRSATPSGRPQERIPSPSRDPSPSAVIAAFQSANSVLPPKCAPSPDACSPPSQPSSPRAATPSAPPAAAGARPLRPLPIRAPSAAPPPSTTQSFSTTSTPTASPHSSAFQRLVSDPNLLSSLSKGVRQFAPPPSYPTTDAASPTTSAPLPTEHFLLRSHPPLTFLRTSAPSPYPPTPYYALPFPHHPGLILRHPLPPTSAPPPEPPRPAQPSPPAVDPRLRETLVAVHHKQDALDYFQAKLLPRKPAPGFTGTQWEELHRQITWSREQSLRLIREGIEAIKAAAGSNPHPAADSPRPSDAPPLRTHPHPHPEYPPGPSNAETPFPPPRPAATPARPPAPDSDPRSSTRSHSATPPTNGSTPRDAPSPPRKSPASRYTVPMVVPRPPSTVPPPVAEGTFWTPPPQPHADSTAPSSPCSSPEPPESAPMPYASLSSLQAPPGSSPSSTPRGSPSPPPPSNRPSDRPSYGRPLEHHPPYRKPPHAPKRLSHTGPSRLGPGAAPHKRPRGRSPSAPHAASTAPAKRARRTTPHPASPRALTDPRAARAGGAPLIRWGPLPGGPLPDAPETADAVEGLLQLAESVPSSA